MSNKPAIQSSTFHHRGSWQNPWQIYQAHKDFWNKITKEDIDIEEFKKKKLIAYFDREPVIMIHDNEYDRYFHFDDVNSKEKLHMVRENIFKEEEERTVPATVSHTYGHRRTNLECKTWVSFKRVNSISDIYRRSRLNLKPHKKLPRVEEIKMAPI